MNREEIRKKWKNRELAEISQKKLARQEDTQVSPTKQVVSQGSSWERVQNRANEIAKTNVFKDIGSFFKGIGLGSLSGGVSALGQTEFLSQQRSNTYRNYNQRQTKIKEQQDLKTADEKLAYNQKQLDNSKLVNGVLAQKQPSINESGTMQYYKQKQDEINQKMAENAESATTRVGKYLAGNVAPSMGQSLTGTALDLIAPGAGSAYRMLSYSGNYTQDGLNKGMNENQASMYGLTMAGVETAMDTIGDKLKGIAIGKAKSANGLKDFIKASAKELGINSFFEGAGEGLTEPLQELVSKAYGGQADFEGIAKRMGQSFLAGAVSELLMTGASLGYGGSINAIEKIQNGQEVSSKEISNALKEIQDKKQVNVEEILQNNLQFAENNLQQENQATTTPNNEILNQEQQTIQQEGKQAQNQTSEQIDNKEQKVLNLRQSIDNFNNSRTEGQEIFDINNEETRKEIEAIQKVVEDRNINIKFDENRFKDNSQNAFYEYDENGNVANIVLNPNSTTKKYVENLAIHELVHSFSGDKKANLMKEVVNYTKTLEGYDKAYQDIKSNYEKVYGKNVSEDVINEEVVANILGEKLGNKEFVNDLVNGKYSTQNRNFVQKIYDFVKNQINRFKGYKNQEQYWKHVKELFDDAYKNSEINKGRNIRYSVDGIESSNKESFSIKTIEERLSGDELLNVQDLIDEIKSVGAEVDKNGYITVYHQTTPENAKKILESGKMSAKENGIFFSTSENASQAEGRGEEKLQFKIPAEFFELDDIFDNNADLRIPLKNKNDFFDISSYIVDKTIKNSNKDSQGRILTKQQQEYFKDSKVRDENGNLMPVYHGTNAQFTIFNNEKIGTNTNNEGIFGKGFYFTENKQLADGYNRKNGKVAKDGSGTTMKLYLDIKNPFYWNEINTPEKMQQFIKETGMPKYVLKWNNTLKNQMHAITDIKAERKFSEILQKNGYDGVIYNYNNNTGEYIIFNSNQAKNVDNTNPTTNPDIRFSKDTTGEWNNFIEKYFKNEGTGTSIKDMKKLPEMSITKYQEVLDNAKYIPQEDKQNLLSYLEDIKKNKSSLDDFKKIVNDLNENYRLSIDTEQQAEQQENVEQQTQQPVEQTVKEEKTVQEISEKRNIKNEEIKNETKFNKLTKEQEQKIKAIKDDLERRKKYISLQADKQMARKKIKGLSMQASAEIRKIIQGDYLIPVEGGLTNIELKNRIEYLRSNYKGKKVIVNDKQGTIIGNAYGKVGVKFEDGTQKYLDKKFIKPVENIDEIINKQAQQNQTEQRAEGNKQTDIKNQKSKEENMQQENVEQGQEVVEEEKTRKKILNPTEISNLKLEDVNTTPELKDKKYKKGTKESNFAENIENDVGFLTEEQKKEILKDDNVKYYAPVTNADTLAKAFNNLNENGQNATYEWYAKQTDNATAEDVATGWILLKQYADKGDTQGMVNVAKKMRDMGTKAGQTVQAFNILSRLTPEGMVAYTQGELQDAYNEMVKGKTKKWIEQHKGDFDLSQEEVAFIMDTMQNLPVENPDTNNYERKVALGQIQKIFTDKIPSEGGKIKAWMRISMLFNPKTQVRNVAGNAMVVPVNAFSDFLGSKVDKVVSKKTGVRTLGNPNAKSYLKGAKQGLYQSYNDFKLGINTRGIEGSKFEFGEGNSFNNKGLGKALNRTENILNFVMDAGDRAFSQGSFVNSLNNQMVLNGVDTPTQEMIDIATQEALSRTWNDNNEYTRFVLGIRNGLNKVGTKSYGLGDVLIPFAKTPANLTKAIVDYSPVGLVNAIKEGNNLKNAIETGQFTAMQQHKFVDSLGKAVAGTMLYVIGYALAKAGIATGEADDDKDVKNFMKNSLGINSYSIKIGDKSFTYDWAQPVATPIAIMTNLNKVNKENPDASTLEKALNAVNIGTNQIMEQSFMESLNEVLNGNGEITERIQKALLDLPARAVPTFSKQIADLVDSTQRTSFEYGKPLQSSINAVKAKIPFASKTLTPVVDTLGNEVKRYGGENNLFNVFLNPSNMNKGQLSQAGKEIYNVYMQTGDTKVFPVTAPYYINYKGDKITMTSKQKADYQRIAGKYTEEVINKLLSNDSYNSLTDEEKAEVLTNVVNDSNSKAKKDVLNIENKNSNIDLIEKIGSNYYTFKVDLKNALDKKRQETGKETATLNDSESISVLQQGNYSKKEKDLIYKNIINDKDDVYDNLKLLDNNSLACVDAYFDYKTSDFSNDREDDGTAKGKAITGTGRNKLKNFLNSFSNSELTPMQKLYLVGVNNSSLNANERAKLKKYIYSLNITEEQRKKIESKLKFTTEMSDGTISWKYN